MADHLTDEEQIEQLKNWWKQHGAMLTVALLTGLIVYFGFLAWKNHQQQQAEQASTLYTELLESTTVEGDQPLSEEQRNTAGYLLQQLQEDHSSSQYAVNASLLMAKLAIEAQEPDKAKAALEWAVKQANDHIKDLVELRLARVYLSTKHYDEALALLEAAETEENPFLSLQAELQGDILLEKQDIDSARKAYQQAIDALEDGDNHTLRRQLLHIKLADIAQAGDNG